MTVGIGEGVQESVAVVEGTEPEQTQPEVKADEKTEEAPKEGEGKAQEQKPEEQPEHKETRVQKRIDRLTRDKYQLRGENEALKRQLEMLQNGQQQQPINSGKPTREQFGSDAEFIEALTDYKAHQIKEEIKAEKSHEIVQTSYEKQTAEARKAYEDFDDVIEDLQSVKVSTAVNEAVMSSPHAAELLYELGKNMEKAASLANMPVSVAIKEIGKIEAAIEARKAQPKPAQKVTKATEPIKPVANRGSAQKRDHLAHPEDYTVEEWREAEKKRKEKLNKR